MATRMATATATTASAAGGHKEQEDAKAQLAREICSVPSIFSSCTHRRRSSPASARRGFVDWYLILRVDENVGIDAIRRRYRQLALQLHPDKNGHPKAEVAFKLVSEAYGCLSDRARRQDFNSERQDNFCKECHRKSLPNSHKTQQQQQQQQQRGTQSKTAAAAHHARPRRALIAALQEVQKVLKEECRVIENCLKATQTSRAGTPLFDPSDCVLFPNYPHLRPRISIPQEYKRFHVKDFRSYRRKGAESPLYELNSDCI